MRKQKNPFATSKGTQWYDLYDDWNLIEASFAKQYGIRIRQHTDMPWLEFYNLISGLMPDTPLGQVVEIRMETDKKIISKFNSSQRKIHLDWKNRIIEEHVANLDEDKYNEQMKLLEQALIKAYANQE